MIELLAPAKDKECAISAINYGADAVYIGACEFGARKNAQNSLSDIAEVVEYAHKFNAKVYVTVNTILTESEVKKADTLIKELKRINVDALIIQDMALIKIAKKYNICIHASTQCDNRTVEKVKFLENVGFSRVVLARELSLEQIKEIRKNTNIELECFIHGALCVSYSGQCYMSYAIGGRSANRGECAQCCRKKYSLVDEKGKFLAKNKYLLCLKDFNLSKYLSDFEKLGVLSLKIEGRLKDINYVKNVVAYYRKELDKLNIQRTSTGHTTLDFEPDLEKSFNRGFTDYFFEKRKDCFTFDSPKSRGEFLGKVKTIGKNYFLLDKQIKLSPQDGLCFTINDEFSGCLVNKFENNKIYPNKMPKIKVGEKVFRNSNVEFEKALKNSKTERKIFAHIIFMANSVSLTDEFKNTATVEFTTTETANNQEKMKESIIKQFKKTGDSIFEIKDVEIKSKDLPFLPVSKLNELRRELIKKLEENRHLLFEKYFDNTFANTTSQISDFPTQTVDYRANILNKSAEEFYIEHNAKVKEFALESGISCKGKCVMHTKHCLRFALNLCKKITPQDTRQLFLVDEKNKKYKLEFDCKNCEMKIFNS